MPLEQARFLRSLSIMKLLIIAILAVSLSSCATAHQYCMEHQSEYRDYDQCYAERHAKEERRHYALSHAFDGMAKQQDTAYRPVNCTSFMTGNMLQTNCN